MIKIYIYIGIIMMNALSEDLQVISLQSVSQNQSE